LFSTLLGSSRFSISARRAPMQSNTSTASTMPAEVVSDGTFNSLVIAWRGGAARIATWNALLAFLRKNS
jgi:hypothetical protein